MCCGTTGDDAGAIKSVMQAREYVVAEERAGRNVLVKAAETFSAEPWRDGWWISSLLLHGSQGWSHAGANGLERKSGTFSALSHTQLNGPSS